MSAKSITKPCLIQLKIDCTEPATVLNGALDIFKFYLNELRELCHLKGLQGGSLF